MNRVFGESAISCLMVRKDAIIVHQSEGDFSLHDRIDRMLSEEPFLMVRQSTKEVTMSKLTMHQQLTDSMRRKLRPVNGVPHSESETVKPVHKATELLELLHSTLGVQKIRKLTILHLSELALIQSERSHDSLHSCSRIGRTHHSPVRFCKFF
jgi:hypothetical protein